MKKNVLPFHPDLAGAKWIPKIPVNRFTLPLYRAQLKPKQPTASVDIQEIDIPTRGGGQRVRLFRPAQTNSPLPLVFWIHGGGMVGGSPFADEYQSIKIVEALGVAVVNVSYRFAPEHPAPAAIDDVEDEYLFFINQAQELSLDPTKIVVAGASAGGGLSALLTQRLRYLLIPQPLMQVLLYPMLDDRTVLNDIAIKNMRAWFPSANIWAWRAFLNAEPGSVEVQKSFVPARESDLSQLPPAWIGVGNLDLFLEEDREYAQRLSDAGVECDLVIVEGAFHGFDTIFRNAAVSQHFFDMWVTAISARLNS